MSISSHISGDGKVVTLNVDGRFDSTLLEDFRKGYEEKSTPTVEQYVVNLQRTEHLDSSALGMLLVLRDFAGGDQSNISIVNTSADVKNVFVISNFTKLFDVN